MNRMWSVRTRPYRVLTVVPSMIGRRSRWTPSRLTSGPRPPSRPAILSTSSRKMMPECSTRSMARRATWSISTRRFSSSSIRNSRASLIFTRRFLDLPPQRPGIRSWMWMPISSTPALEKTSKGGAIFSLTSSSSVRSSSRPSRSCFRSFSRVSWKRTYSPSTAALSLRLSGGSSMSRIFSSTLLAALSRTSSIFSCLTMSTEMRTRSRIMDSTSRPT